MDTGRRVGREMESPRGCCLNDAVEETYGISTDMAAVVDWGMGIAGVLRVLSRAVADPCLAKLRDDTR